MIDIQAAIASLSAVREIVKVGIDAKVDAKATDVRIEVMGRLGQASDALYALRDELFRLQAENSDLKREAEEHAAFATRAAQYELIKTAGGAVVWKYKGEPEHYACPNCLNHKRVEILQTNRTRLGKYRCTVSTCGAEYPIEPAVPMKAPSRSVISGGAQGWMR